MRNKRNYIMKNPLLTLCIALSILLISCGKNDNLPLTINQTEVTMRYDGTFDFSIRNVSDVEWSSSDEFVGIVGRDGKFEARHIGETTVTGRALGEFVTARVVVEPNIVGVIEPYIAFGETLPVVKDFEKRQLLHEASDLLVYTDASDYTSRARYFFEGDLFTSVSLFWSDARTEEGKIFYAERYEFLGSSNNVHYYTDKSNSLLVSLTNDRLQGFFATYSRNTRK